MGERVEPTERKGLNREWIEGRNSRVFSLAPWSLWVGGWEFGFFLEVISNSTLMASVSNLWAPWEHRILNKSQRKNWTWWYMPLIPTLGKQRQENPGQPGIRSETLLKNKIKANKEKSTKAERNCSRAVDLILVVNWYCSQCQQIDQWMKIKKKEKRRPRLGLGMVKEMVYRESIARSKDISENPEWMWTWLGQRRRGRREEPWG